MVFSMTPLALQDPACLPYNIIQYGTENHICNLLQSLHTTCMLRNVHIPFILYECAILDTG
jgi:hypothetical protein